MKIDLDERALTCRLAPLLDTDLAVQQVAEMSYVDASAYRAEIERATAPR